MREYKYPYIPKEYYAAVMFACKMIRENGNFNKAVKIAAIYYDVDEQDVKKHVRARQSAGQKGTTRKYKYYKYAVFKGALYGDEGYCTWWGLSTQFVFSNLIYGVIKASSESNAQIQLGEKYERRFEDALLTVGFKEFDKKSDAENYEFDKNYLWEKIIESGAKDRPED